MVTYYKENIGLQTPQGDPLDYFQIMLIGLNEVTNQSGAEIRFYFREADALENKIPNSSRVVFWPHDTELISEMKTELFSFDTIDTTNGEPITLKNPSIV